MNASSIRLVRPSRPSLSEFESSRLAGETIQKLVSRFPPNASFRQLSLQQLPQAVDLARMCYPQDLLRQCLQSFCSHDAAQRAGLDDGRVFFGVYRNSQLAGVCGLHQYDWGPPGICWASWFFVHPMYRSGATAALLFTGLLRAANEKQYRYLYLETPTDHASYSAIDHLLERLPFVRQATLPDYYEPGVAMLIYRLALTSS